MVNNSYQYILTGSGILGEAYFFPKQQIAFFATQSFSGSTEFGLFKEDVIEFAAYSTNNDLNYWGYTQTGSNELIHNRQYTDLSNKTVNYNYTTNTKNFVTLNGSFQLSGSSPEIVVSPVSDLNNAGYGDGSYVVSYNFFRNIVGDNSSASLLIKDISPSRTEIKVAPQYLRTTTDIGAQKTNQQYYAFANNIPYVKFIIDDIKSNIENPPIYSNYYSYITLQSPTLLNQLKFDLAFQNDTAVISFIEEIYPQAAFQLEQFLFSNYDSSVSFSDIDNLHNNYCLTVITNELKKIRLNDSNTPLANFDKYVNFFLSLFRTFLNIFKIRSLYVAKFGTSLKYLVNFGNNNIFPILNWTLSTENEYDIVQHQILLIKLATPLPSDIDIGQLFWISNQQFTSLYQTVYVSSIASNNLVQLAGPNFSAKVGTQFSPGKQYNYEELVNTGNAVSSDIINVLNNKTNFDNINIDYTSIENFVHFSSIETRLNNYIYKSSQLYQLSSSIQSYNNLTDPYSLSDKQNLIDQSNSIIQNFDGYEKFLYANNEYIDIHAASASVYDKTNPDALFNNIPEWILNDPNNSEYIKFIKMIGQHFDLIWLYIENFPSIQYVENSFSKITENMISTVLESFGWNYNIGTENQDLALNFLGQDYDGNVIQGSGKDRTFEISKRILNNLPYLLKTKGTEESIRALFKCYGIPNHIFDIREYGGIEYTTGLQNDSYFIFDDLNYMLTVKNPDEYIQTPWSSDVHSVEFKFSIDPDIDDNARNILLAVNFNNSTQSLSNWAIGIVRQDYGSVNGQIYFTINDGYGNYKTTFLDSLPVFNGEIFTLHLRKNPVQSIYNIPICPPFDITEVPTQYDFILKQYLNTGFSFQSSSSLTLVGDYNRSFIDENSSISIGNNPEYVAQTGSVNYFQGSFDNIRLWSLPLSDTVFDHHVQFSEAYDFNDPTSLVDALLLRLDFDIPVDLSVTESYSLSNGAFNNTLTGSITANNFRSVAFVSSSVGFEFDNCPTGSYIISTMVSGTFPYQFTEFDTRETVQLPNFGANKFRSNKIRIETQDLISPLSYNSRSTLKSRDREPADSNKLAIVFSPIDQLNLDILKFFGNFQLGDFIGDPSDLKHRHYKKFDQYKKFYYAAGFNNINFQQYINTLSSFIDKSLFEHIKNLTPARAKLLTGILIEPTILERSKVAVLPPELSYVTNYQTSIDSSAKIIVDNIKVNSASLDIGTRGENIAYDNSYFQRFFGEVEDGGFGIFADSNNIAIVREANLGNTYVYNKYKVEIISQSFEKYAYDSSGSITSSSISTNRLNLIPIPNGVTPSTITGTTNVFLNGYYKTHYKFKRHLFNRYSVQDITTTIDPISTLPDGSSPIVSTKVDRGTIVVNTQAGGNILNTQ